jgi:hypothetical protein
MSTSIAPDRQIFTLIFDKYYATMGPGIGIEQNRKNCQINVALRFPKGWSFSVFSSQFRGYVQMDKGIHGQHVSTWYFSGQTQQVKIQSDFYGPADRDYLTNDSVGVTAWSPCGMSAMLNVNSQVRMFNEGGARDAYGLLTNDSQDNKFEHKLGIRWKSC